MAIGICDRVPLRPNPLSPITTCSRVLPGQPTCEHGLDASEHAESCGRLTGCFKSFFRQSARKLFDFWPLKCLKGVGTKMQKRVPHPPIPGFTTQFTPQKATLNPKPRLDSRGRVPKVNLDKSDGI